MGERVWQLRAMGVPEILDETFRLYRRHFLKLLVITLLVRVWLGPPLALLLINDDLQRDFVQQSCLWELAGGLLYLAAHSLLLAALTDAISEGYLGRQISAKGAFRLALRRVRFLLGVFLATTPASILALVLGYGVIWLVVTVLGPLVSVYMAFIGHHLEWLTVLIGLLLLVLGSLPYLWLNSRLALAVPVVVLEASPPRAALARSWRLTRDNKTRALGVYATLAFLLLLFITLPTFVLMTVLAGFEAPEGMMDAVMVIAPALLSALVMPIRVGGLALLYYDLRFRHEGLDLALQAGALGQAGAPGRSGTPQTAGSPGAPPG